MPQRLKNGCWQATLNLNLENKTARQGVPFYFLFFISQNLKLFLLAP
ncbi:hypothetical protein MCC93_04680 [Morococcus cerebrosus]|uniref:Uncharacterized protein n=1 Tax=Morococcus cerebrosus TaxID=1056807 RepID=A0A0C1H1T0_9NEIS|nr:hypothetical protein MCC93_04680 [Morococcus cerebrosus]